MTNSPSPTSRLTSLTARNPSLYCLTMFCMLMAATAEPLLPGQASGRSALHGACGQTGYDAALEHQHQDDDGDGDDHRGRHDCGHRRLELRGAGEERQGCGYGPGPIGRCKRDCEQELVPAEEERENR